MRNLRDEVLTAKDVGDALGVSERTARRHIKAGRCGKYSEIGGKLRVLLAEFERALKGQAAK